MKTLAEWGRLEPEPLLRLARALAARLAEDHALDAWHGGLTPRAVMWDGGSAVELRGELRRGAADLDALDELCGEAALLATGYLAPEQCGASGAPGPRSDVFAAGVLLYEAATGEHPFAGDRAAEIAAGVRGHRPRPLGHLRPELAVEWDAVTACCLHKDAAQRYASAIDLAHAIDDLFRGGGTRRKRLRTRWGRVALAALAVLGLAILVWWLL